MPGPHFRDDCLRLVGQAQSRIPEEKLGLVEHLVTSRSPPLLAPSASRSPFVLQRHCVPPTGFSYELLKLAAILDGCFHVPSQLIRNVNRKTPASAASVQCIAGMPLPRFA